MRIADVLVAQRFVLILAILIVSLGIAHLRRRSGLWRATIREQRRELRLLLESKTLRNHAAEVLADAYADAPRQAADETELDPDVFPVENQWDLDATLGEQDA